MWRGITFRIMIAGIATVAWINPPSAQASEHQPFGVYGKTIVIDAGHGGADSGARSLDGEIREKDITLSVAKRLQFVLEQAGAHVYMTRTIDDDLATDEDRRMRRRQSMDLRNRTRFGLKANPDAFVSIHCNAVPSPEWRGAHTIYMEGNPEGEHLAKLMQKRFQELMLPTNRAADDMSTLYLLKRIPGPTVLAEIGFVTNPHEAAALISSKYQNTVALAMYLSLLDYFQEVQPANPEHEHHSVWQTWSAWFRRHV